MSENEVYYKFILNKISKSTSDKLSRFTVQDLLYENSLLEDVSELDIRKTINWAISKGIITIVNKDKFGDDIYIFSNNDWYIQEDSVQISVTAPKSAHFSIEKVIDQNGFIPTDIAFKQVISYAKHTIRICSPFLQKNVANENSMPDLEDIILSAYKRGCKLLILSREVIRKRATDLNWIIDFSRKNGFADRLEIYDYYHMSKKDDMIDSSIHAKLIIADDDMAYIGSAELRLNSIYKNFEVGIVLTNPSIIGLVELFDSMTSIAEKVY